MQLMTGITAATLLALSACVALAALPAAAFDLDGIRSGMTEQQLIEGRRDKSLTIDHQDEGALVFREKGSGEIRYYITFCQSKSNFAFKTFQPSMLTLTALIDSTMREYGAPKVSTRMNVASDGESRILMFDFPPRPGDQTRVTVISQTGRADFSPSLSKTDDTICPK